MSTLDDEERYLREVLARLQEDYHKAAKPYVDRLVTIYAMRPPQPTVLNSRDWPFQLPDRVPPL